MTLEAVTAAVGIPLGSGLPIVTTCAVLFPVNSAFRVGAILMGNLCVAPLICVALLFLRSACLTKGLRFVLLTLSCANAGLFALAAVTMLYDPAIRITPMTQGAAVSSYSFDNNGSQIQEYLPGAGLTVNAFDFENRLTSSLVPAGTRSTYSYAGDTGLRRTRQEGTATCQPVHTVVWDSGDYLGEY